jgi:hypothetical protein
VASRAPASLLSLVAALAIGAGCGRDPAQSGRGGSPTARHDVHAQLVEDAATQRHPSDGGGRGWLAEDPGPLRAGEKARFVVLYEAGPLGIAVGGTLYFQGPAFWGWVPPQLGDRWGRGYTEVSSEAAGVELRAQALERGLLAIGIAGRALAPGERVRIVYGAGPAGVRVDRYAERGQPLWLQVDGDGDGVRGTVLDSPRVDILPGPPERLVLTLPSTARPGESVRLVAAVLDAEGSAGVETEGEIVFDEVPEGLPVPARLGLPAAARGRAKASVVAAAPGLYRLRARGPGGLEAESNPLLVSADVRRVLWADLHGHSALSDGTGTPEDYYRYARDVAALDVAALTDHDHWGMPFLDASPELWREIVDTTRAFHEPGRFVTILGYEWTSWVHGHRHVLHFEDEAEIRSCIDPEHDSPRELWGALRGRPALTFAHHSAGGPVATDWSIPPDPELEPVTEIVSVHGSSEALDSPQPIYSPVPGNFVRDVLTRGYRLGFVGSGDSHDGHPGLVHVAARAWGGVAAILAEERTREAVLAALRARRVYATNGPRILVDVRLGGQPMGSRIGPGTQPLELRVVAPRPIDRVDVVRDGLVTRAFPGEGRRELEVRDVVPDLRSGEQLYLRVVQEDDGAAWISPFFVE